MINFMFKPKLQSTGLLILLWFFQLSVLADGKKKMDPSVYDIWKSIDRNYVISNNGEFVSYVISPQEGDSYLYFYNVSSGDLDSIPRGKNPVFSESCQFLAFSVKAQSDSIRHLKLKKVKKNKFPKDSLFIENLSSGERVTIAGIEKWSMPKDGGDWLAYLLDKEVKKKEEPQDTSESGKSNEGKKEKPKKKKEFKSNGKPLVFYRPSTGDSLYVEKVRNYSIADNGASAYLVQSIGDTTEVSKVLKFNPATFTLDTIFNKIGKIDKIECDYTGDQVAFLFTDDTTKVKVNRLYLLSPKMKAPQMILDTISNSLPQDWSVLSKGALIFSRDGSKLYFGAGDRLHEEAKDTLTNDEKVHVDVWNWKDLEIQPMQQKHLKRDKHPVYKCVYHIKDKKIVQLESEYFKSVKLLDNGNLNIGFSQVDTPYKRSQSWTGKRLFDIYKVDFTTGKKILLLNEISSGISYSENGKWLVYYHTDDSTYYSMNISSGEIKDIAKGIDVSFVDELNDMPMDAYPYGGAGFTNDGKSVLVYDRYDIWQLDLEGKKAPVNLTKRQGRETNTAFRYIKLDREEDYINLKERILLSANNDINMQTGFYALDGGELKSIVEGDYYIYNPVKAKEADVYVWRKSTYEMYPELLVSDDTFLNPMMISNTNPQQKEYVWGDIQLVDWIASDGLEHKGLLVTPEDMDTNKKYPMVCYFYERNTDMLHRYRAPAPSRSTVNWNFYASNGYVIFIPDIYYRTGDPGLCAYEAVVSGALAMSAQFDFIDRENMAIQGQSWGGYQVAHLVTRTNLFKAAMAGAPVSNMTSAYGGIRWGSGMSRMFQYEHTQSRIGGTLWEKTNKYIENSPVFFAPQVETPLLIMHNDNDGAVPWYQGIEYFMALRRLNKPVWMLVYNNEEHNLTRRANSKDLSIRMMQFFDHYLKSSLMPVWMKDGVPATLKGEDLGYELVE